MYVETSATYADHRRAHVECTTRSKPCTTQEETTMETLLLIIGIAAVALLLFRPAPRTQII